MVEDSFILPQGCITLAQYPSVPSPIYAPLHCTLHPPMLMVTSPDWINSPAHLSCNHSYRSKMSNHDKTLICYQQPDTLLCLPVVCDVCHCLDNCLLSCIAPDQVTTDQSPGDCGGLSVHWTRDLSVLSAQCPAVTRADGSIVSSGG